jgi:thymidylate synthase ThyX
MRAHPLPEARSYADLMLTELRKVIPSFLKRVDITDRGVAASAYLATTRTAMEDVAERLLPGADGTGDDAGPAVTLVDFDPDAEVKLVTSMLYPYVHAPEVEIERRVRAMGVEDRLAVVRAYVGERSNRRHRPGRAFERPTYRFDVLADYGAFRDLQRHRMLTVEWQPLSPRHGFTRPEAIDEAGLSDRFDEVMERSAALHDTLLDRFPAQAAYAVALAYRVRFSLQLNAREAMHLIELRTTPQGHPAYRTVAQQMHTLIAEQAGHHAVAAAMRFADHSPEPTLERLESERRAELRRLSR